LYQLPSLPEANHKLSQDVTLSDDLHYWLALLYAPGIGSITFQKILGKISHPRHLFESLSDTLLAEKINFKKDTLAYLKKPDWKRVEQDIKWAREHDCHIISLTDPEYPPLLKEIATPPPVLFVRGNPDVLALPQLAMVGSRNPSAGGRQMASDFARILVDLGLAITSGLALGIDAASHEGALETGITIAVAGTGLDRVYPSRHRELAHRILEQGAIVSEFPPGTPSIAANFPRRNRIISGLSIGTLVVEAAVKSGSLITAKLAAEQGREVFAIPGSIHNPLSRGCHQLIQQGAKLVETVADILDELGPLVATVLETIKTETPESIFFEHGSDSLTPLIEKMGFEPISIDTLVERCGLTPETVSSMLLTLELQGRVTSAGGLYSRIDKSR